MTSVRTVNLLVSGASIRGQVFVMPDVIGKPVDLERLALAVQVSCILSEQQASGSKGKK